MKKSPGQRLWTVGRCRGNCHKDRLERDQRPSDARRKEEGKKSLKKRRPKTRQSISTRTENKKKKCVQSDAMGTGLYSSRINQDELMKKKKEEDEKTSLWRKKGGQRHSLPSSVIIWMLDPVFFSWLNATKGCSVPGLANGHKTVREGRGGWDSGWKAHVKERYVNARIINQKVQYLLSERSAIWQGEPRREPALTAEDASPSITLDRDFTGLARDTTARNSPGQIWTCTLRITSLKWIPPCASAGSAGNPGWLQLPQAHGVEDKETRRWGPRVHLCRGEGWASNAW